MRKIKLILKKQPYLLAKLTFIVKKKNKFSIQIDNSPALHGKILQINNQAGIMTFKKNSVTSGIRDLDKLLGGGVFIGDNVVWYDAAGILAPVFSLNLINASRIEKKSLIYLSFDRSPTNLLEQLGPLANNPFLTIFDCFTHGKGESSDVFLDFYNQKAEALPCRIICIDEPHNADHVAGAFYGLHKTMEGDVRFIFESLTGMQELWGGEEHILRFYSHSCPRLYELNTIAYWIVEKEAHSQRLKAHLNKITQVAIDLSLKRGKTYLSVLKAEKRDIGILNKQTFYWNKGIKVTFDPGKSKTGQINLGQHLKELRTQRGMSQIELSKHVGVTPSTISQVENNQIYPSLPALIKMSEILSVDVSYFFKEDLDAEREVVFPESGATPMPIPGLSKSKISSKLLSPVGFESQVEPYLIEIPSKTKLSEHFYTHKGEEMGYLISGELILSFEQKKQTVHAGDTVYLTKEIPSKWENKGKIPARMLWIKVK